MDPAPAHDSFANTRPPAYVRLAGDLDLARKAELRILLAPLACEDVAILDVSGVPYLDSTALGCFVSLRLKMLQNGRKGIVAIVGANANLRRIFRICQLDVIFSMYETIQEIPF